MQTIFVSCPFQGDYREVIGYIKRVADSVSMRTVSVDQESSLAGSIPEEIRRGVQESRVVLADITGKNPNVLNEIGLAQAYGKTLILITRDSPTDAPFNIRALRILKYSIQDLSSLGQQIERALQEVLYPGEPLRAMIAPRSLGAPDRDSRFVIAASPLSFRRATNRVGGYKTLRRTDSDYVGIRGILQAFGQMYGFETLPDHIDPEDYMDGAAQEAMNLYCIASPKANSWTGIFLEEFGRRWAPAIDFRADATSLNLRNVMVSLFCDDVTLLPSGWLPGKGDRYYRDFGIVVRGPNPYHPKHMVAVLAGRSSLGTHAACAAFTDPASVTTIEELLRAHRIDMEDHTKPFWALVSMKRREGDEKEEAISESLRVVRVEPFKRREA